ncbi:ORF E-54 [Sulfolobus spindle-shaped virus 1]|uniref:Uncharacterized protein E-54 n=1 Tax=Sulfolobus spindle-shape virus 1 TaxID=244589 RepID=E54_SSV1|nr:ORF E-54 [Sulfolobus spindle-shaped virus 1]P20218.1 RecName: Full=Uncharacterized protein E-54 [Sulfolobus spindle-shaped virus 1]CAA30212.1 ORF E-54 [Sulfolobus spindle-shaped virus 1]
MARIQGGQMSPSNVSNTTFLVLPVWILCRLLSIQRVLTAKINGLPMLISPFWQP